MHEVGTRVIVLHKEQIKELRERLQKRKSPNVIVIDSITALIGFTRAVFIELINEFPDKLFIFIAHEEKQQTLSRHRTARPQIVGGQGARRGIPSVSLRPASKRRRVAARILRYGTRAQLNTGRVNYKSSLYDNDNG